MLIVWVNWMLFKLFGQKKDRLIFAYEKTIYRSYSSMQTSKYITFEKAIRRIQKNKKPCRLFIQSKFNGNHYPVVDVDDDIELPNMITKLNRSNIHYVVFQSSPNHYWIIIDIAFDRFNLGQICLTLLGMEGDKKYVEACNERQAYQIRAYTENPDRLPHIISNYDLPMFPRGSINQPSKNTETGAWRASYFKHRVLKMNNVAYTVNFSKFVEHLVNYYTTDIKKTRTQFNYYEND